MVLPWDRFYSEYDTRLARKRPTYSLGVFMIFLVYTLMGFKWDFDYGRR